MLSAKAFEKNALFLIGATRGGPMRARIMRLLLQKPQNPNMLAQMLGVDYKTVTHHLDVLKKHNWVIGSAQKYGETFMPTFTREERAVFEGIMGESGKKL
ncbi:MAG TPA: winged helix-turn-helix domain-containing protein [archaeon]|nr:winged helix-turn-helix domain-containing protein [archaeon]